MTNFDFLAKDSQFISFADSAMQAEKALAISPAHCAASCRKALEDALKWMYSADKSLPEPYSDHLTALIGNECFREILPKELFSKIDYIRKLGDIAIHGSKSITIDKAILSLEGLHSFLNFICFCYGIDCKGTDFDRSQLTSENKNDSTMSIQSLVDSSIDFKALLEENRNKRERFSDKRISRLKNGYEVKPSEYSEDQTREVYIDTMLNDAGWQGWSVGYPIDEMPNKSGCGFADYVLFGDDGSPLAVIEAKRTSRDVAIGRQQAVLYANFLEKKFGRRPMIFLTNGYETRFWDDRHYPERPVSGIFSKRDLLKEFNKMENRKPLRDIKINDEITNRYYQKEAILSVCEALNRNRRKALLVMATGSGKTRTIISLVDVLIRNGWIKNVLFLADRSALVIQAFKAFNDHAPNLSLCNLTKNKEGASNRVILSTYQTMINCIDNTYDEKGNRLYTPGHFDLIIVDEAHRSIYRRYKDIFTYFDALLVGMTATPKDDIDKNTYEIFDLEIGVPTYGYELSQAVKDRKLVDYLSIETELKLLKTGIVYDDLPDDEKEEYEETFSDEDGNMPELINSEELNVKLFNYDTIKQVLHYLMDKGQRVDYGTKIGKTIIFAKNHNHAEEIVEVWGKEFPELPQHYCRVIDNQVNYVEKLIEDFSDSKKYPQIAVSVDMLDTGIDIPEILNLVFFKKVFSRAKFWQMIGRGTRLCPELIDGQDKDCFYIFDFCENFAFFRTDARGREVGTTATLQEKLFNTKVEIIYRLQDLVFQTDELKNYRNELVASLLSQIDSLNRDSFAVKLHWSVIDRYQDNCDFDILTYGDTLEIAEHIAPLIPPSNEDVSAQRFDMLLYQIEHAIIAGRSGQRAKNDLYKKTLELSHYATVPDIIAQREIIEQILHNDYLERAGITDYEEIRLKLRDLIKYIPDRERVRYDTNFTDDIMSETWNASELDSEDLANYKKKIEHYIKQHQDIPVIKKLKDNMPLTSADMEALEGILWKNLGTKEQYETQYGMPLGELVRSIVGLSLQAANEAFSKFLNDVNLNERQRHFVKQIINYICKNGMMKDNSVLTRSPFTDMGRVSEIFTMDSLVLKEIRATIEEINRNAVLA
ncbi:type I restriction enzyme EcoKI subunit R [Candidatus Methanoplasma termitum]|uniref:Type I restriction enzyme EcoKI subunit R n=1 Tax=Candidatus Methanoplasma termitum TaxID=1577791 RepID=A0A0A7LBW2_9ARCH|nr:DEAD/DEAH box helicase family protein [Candidatus Methanoplasma termitum]AIZ56625.1 type I restriction enzyme EcoKI subunit R [Candidatus Methanoplasma termitum]